MTTGNSRARLIVWFVVYLLLLAWIVLWKLEVPYLGSGGERRIKLVPFAPTADAGASSPVEVLANVLLFVPFGPYLRLLAPSWPWWRTAAAVAGTSLALEVAQYVLAVGSSDVTDVIANTAGALTGLGLGALAPRRSPAQTRTVLVRVCLTGTALLLVAVAAFVASPVHLAQPG